MKNILLLFCLFVFVSSSAQSVIGTWKSIDDNTGKARSHIEIYQKNNGKVYGKIVKIIDPAKVNNKCTKCKGDKKNQPLLGLIILEGLEKDGDKYEDGEITDPDSGKVYDCYIELQSKNKLKVRGYLGMKMLGRTQIWQRVQ